MNLAEEYARQFAWRDWPRALDALPPLAGTRVLDVGCAHGDLAAELAARGASVLGVDGNEELVAAARGRALARCEFRVADARALAELGAPFDGLWASFAAAYFVELAPVLERWRALLAPGGWIALTEIDDLFAHEPVSSATRARLESYLEESRRAGRYDFRMGRRLAAELARAGYRVERELVLADREFACDGPLAPAVLEAWKARLERMRLLHEHCGSAWPEVRGEFLAALASPAHRSHARVVFVLARRGA